MKKLQQLLERMTQKNSTLAFLINLAEVFFDRRVTRSAAELSYYLMLTLFTTLIVIIDVIGRLPLNVSMVTSAISDVLPQDTARLLGDYLKYVQLHQSTTMFTGAIITIITAASAAFRGLVSISGEIYGRIAFQGMWGVLFSLVFSVLLVLMIYLSFLMVLTGNWFIHLLRDLFPFIHLPVYWRYVRLVLMFAIAMLFLALLYWLTGPKGLARPPVLIGAFLSSLLLTLGVTLFSALITFSSRYSLVYGSLASMIILMVWLYFCGNIVIFGNVFNYVYWRRSRGLPVSFILEKKL